MGWFDSGDVSAPVWASLGRHIVNILGRSLRGITLDKFQQSDPYARAKSCIFLN